MKFFWSTKGPPHEMAKSQLKLVSGMRSSYQQFIFAAVDAAKLVFGTSWPLQIMFTDYQIVERNFPWVDMGQPNIIAVLLPPH